MLTATELAFNESDFKARVDACSRFWKSEKKFTLKTEQCEAKIQIEQVSIKDSPLVKVIQ